MTASLNKKSFDELAEDEFHGFQIKFMLGNSKAPVYLINTPSTNQTYALKLFRYNGDSINPHYVNEARFCFLQHQNIIKYVKQCDRFYYNFPYRLSRDVFKIKDILYLRYFRHLEILSLEVDSFDNQAMYKALFDIISRMKSINHLA